MNNIAILDNPYSEGIVVSTNGVGVSSKAAKINDDKKSFPVTKKDRLIANWEKNKPAITTAPPMSITSEPKNYSSVLSKLEITPVNYAKEVTNNGAKKLRVNQIVNGKTTSIYNSSAKIDVTPLPEPKKEEPVIVEQPIVEEKSTPIEPPKPIVEERKTSPLESAIMSSRSDIHGRHEHTGEIPVDLVREAVRNDNPNLGISRMERNIGNEPAREEIKQETNGVDMDLYTSLMQNTGQEDVSKQLQGAKKELSMEKEESRKLAEQYGQAVRELNKLKEEIESKKKMKEQHEKQELSTTLNDLETIKRENLERTSDLSAIRAEISKLEAQKRALEDSTDIYSDYRSYGRAS